jgi:hypothetical protein
MKAKPPTLTLAGQEHIASAADSVRLPTKRAQQADHGPSGPGNPGNVGFIRLNGDSLCQDSRARLQDPQFATLPYPYKTDCLSCHLPAEASDWIYVQGYPSLKQ